MDGGGDGGVRCDLTQRRAEQRYQAEEEEKQKSCLWHPSRLPSKWGPYRRKDGRGWDHAAFLADQRAFVASYKSEGCMPHLTPSKRSREAQQLALVCSSYCANVALEFINQQRFGCCMPKFQLMHGEAVKLNVIVCDGIWYHTNFKASLDSGDSKLFFAELHQTGPGDMDMEVTACSMFETENHFNTCIHCEPMDNSIRHPFDGFRRGVPLTLHQSNEPPLCGFKSDFIVSGEFWDFEGFFDFLCSSVDERDIEPPPPPPSEQRLKEIARQRAIECSKSALAYYNKHHEENYVLVNAISSRCIPLARLFVHVNFEARRAAADASLELFFAELRYVGAGNGEKEVLFCKKLDRGSPGTRAGCRFCRPSIQCPSIQHPIDGYQVGCSSEI